MKLTDSNIELLSIASAQLYGKKLNRVTSSKKLKALKRFIINSSKWN